MWTQLALLLAATQASNTPAQSPSTIRSTSDLFGSESCAVGDVDGDRICDLLVGAPLVEQSGGFWAGAAVLLSGRTGAPLAIFAGHEPYAGFGHNMVGGADIDGDGVPDFAIAAPWYEPGCGYIDLYSGCTKSLLLELHSAPPACAFGRALAFVPDLDGDGRSELAVSWCEGDWFDRRSKKRCLDHVAIFSTKSGELLRSIEAPSDAIEFGTYLACVDDLDGDQVDDLVIGASRSTAGEPSSLIAISACSGEILFSIDYHSAESNCRGGGSIAVADLDGDGRQDFVVSDASDCVGDGARVVIISGAEHRPIRMIAGSLTGFGCPLAITGDVDGDGRPDIAIAGCGFLEDGTTSIYSSRTGGLLRECMASAPCTDRRVLGASLSSLGDVDGDGVPDLVLGDANSDEPGIPGSVEVLSGATGALIWHQTYLAALEGRVQTPVRGR